jgi:hypothetical protein
MQAQQSSLCDDTSRKPIGSLECREPAMSPFVMHVSVDPERDKDVAVQQPDHVTSSSCSARLTVSAVIGFAPRETTNPLRLIFRLAGPALRFVPPVTDWRSRRFTATLIEQPSSLASDFARAYISDSRLTVSLIPPLWCSGAVVSRLPSTGRTASTSRLLYQYVPSGQSPEIVV